MLSRFRWTAVALFAAAAAPAIALADHDGTPPDAGGRPCAYEGYDAIRMQAPDSPCTAVPTPGGARDAMAIRSPGASEDTGGGAGEPQRHGDGPLDPFRARIWSGP